jgi:hypothetical protein
MTTDRKRTIAQGLDDHAARCHREAGKIADDKQPAWPSGSDAWATKARADNDAREERRGLAEAVHREASATLARRAEELRACAALGCNELLCTVHVHYCADPIANERSGILCPIGKCKTCDAIPSRNGTASPRQALIEAIWDCIDPDGDGGSRDPLRRAAEAYFGADLCAPAWSDDAGDGAAVVAAARIADETTADREMGQG